MKNFIQNIGIPILIGLAIGIFIAKVVAPAFNLEIGWEDVIIGIIVVIVVIIIIEIRKSSKEKQLKQEGGN